MLVLAGLLGRRVGRVGLLYLGVLLAVAALLYLIERHAPESKLGSLGDTLWFCLVTMSTVGYGDVTPVTGLGRIVTGVFILFTLTTIGFLLGAVNDAVLEIKRMEELGLIGTRMTAHTVVCGFGMLARAAVEDLLAAGKPVAILCERVEELPLAREVLSRGEVFVTSGEPTQEILRERLNATQAEAVVIAFGDDAKNLIASLNVRALNPGARVVVALVREELRQTLIAGGVTYVASASELAGRLLASATFEPEVANFVEDVTSGARGTHDLQQYRAGELGGLSTKQIRQRLLEIDGPLLIAVALRRGDGFEVLPHPASDLTVGAEDHLLVLSSREQASRMVERLGVRQGRAPGEGARG
jgi:voltage-gated potassium channel